MKLIASMLLAIVICFCAVPGRCTLTNPIDAKMRAADTRLDKTIEIKPQRLYLAELLHQLSEQTGVTIDTDEREYLSGMPLFVSFDKEKLSDVMNSLWSFLSYKKAAWYWLRQGKAGRYTYYLYPSPDSKELNRRFEKEAQQAFEHLGAVMLEMAKMTPEERKKSVDKLASAFLGESAIAKGHVVDIMNREAGMWAGLKIFTDSLSQEQQDSVMREHQRVTLPVSRLSPQGQAFVHALWVENEAYNILPDGSKIRTTEPKEISFTTLPDSNPKPVSPSLFIAFGGDAGSTIGGGGLEWGMTRFLNEEWMLAEDKRDSPVSSRIVKAPEREQPKSEEENMDNASRLLEYRLRQMAEGAPLSLIVLLPLRHSNYPGAPYKSTVKSYLDLMAEHHYLMEKWRGNISLLADPAWFRNTYTYVPYAYIKTLTSSGGKGRHYLSVVQLSEIYSKCSYEQLSVLSSRFPAIKGAHGFDKLLIYNHKHSELSRSNGSPLNPELLTAIQAHARIPPQHDFFKVTTLAARLRTFDDDTGVLPKRIIRLEYLRSEGLKREWLPLSEIRQYGSISE